jgi:hypothetical protein
LLAVPKVTFVGIMDKQFDPGMTTRSLEVRQGGKEGDQ